MAACEDESGAGVDSGDVDTLACDMSAKDLEKMPQWKKELIQRRKHSSLKAPSSGLPSNNVDDTATTHNVFNDIMTNTPADTNNITGSGAPGDSCTGHSHSQHAPSSLTYTQATLVANPTNTSTKGILYETTSSIQEAPFQLHSRHGSERVASDCCEPSSSSIVVAKKCTFNKNINTVNKSSLVSNKIYTKISERNNKLNSGNMVALQEVMNENFDFDDTSEELQYGPGIVSKLRCRYLSLALRQSANKHRPSLDNLRRATSLNNLLDEEDDEQDATRNNWNKQNNSADEKARTPDEYISIFYKQKMEQNENRCRPSIRGNDSLKRARSVEALMRYDHKAWQRDISKDASDNFQDNIVVLEEITNDNNKGKFVEVSIEDKIINAKERGDYKPKRLTSFMDETERPPPDLVKHTLRIFEASVHRRPKLSSRLGNGDVAAKVATFKTIISQEKPAIIFPKPPLSPKKPVIKPRTSSPKHVLNGNKTNSVSQINNRPKTIPHNLDTHSINNMDKSSSPTSNGTKKVTIESCRSPSPISGRHDTAYRRSKLESPLSPQLVSRISSGNRTKVELPFLNSPLSPISAQRTSLTSRSDNAVLSPEQTELKNICDINLNDSTITQLSKKLENISIVTPANKSLNLSTDADRDTEDDLDSEIESVDGDLPLKHISKAALANISKAGTTTEFKFITQSPIKSHLPATFNGNISPKKVGDYNEPNVRQIGIIRPQIKSVNNSISSNIASTKVSSSSAIKKDIQVLIEPTKQMEEKPNRDNLLITNLMSTNNMLLTSREIEKNFINKEKSEEAKWATKTTINKPWQQADIHNNTMVFNFSNRKDVPDYIENDGLVIRRKRELPKPGESGFVLLGDLAVETSTDPDDSWTLGPPSPCDVEFQNDNVIIDGKSSIKSRNQKLKIQFNDSLTSTFEYPSESSLLDDSDTVNDNGVILNTGLLGNMPLGSAPLGSYTPIKASLNTNFELGVTRSQTSTPSDTTACGPSNGESTESLQYLKPATDEQTVAWSEGTRVTDLLF